MDTSESSKALSLWPKLALWGAVILVGSLYLVSVERKRSSDAVHATPAPAETASVAGGPPTAEAGAGRDAPAAAEKGENPLTQTEAASPARIAARSDPAVVAAQTPTVAPSASGNLHVQAQSAPSEVPSTVVARESDAQATLHAPDGVTETTPTPEAAAQGETMDGPAEAPTRPSEATTASDDVSPAEAEAFAKAVLSEPDEEAQPEETQAPVAPTTTASPETPLTPTTAGEAPAAVGETLQARRARIMAEYRAMQRRAQEEMRRRWAPPAMPMPPYGYPGYPPLYAPRR